jgi:hypothetical protein
MPTLFIFQTQGKLTFSFPTCSALLDSAKVTCVSRYQLSLLDGPIGQWGGLGLEVYSQRHSSVKQFLVSSCFAS